jgi:hypothetical protein
VLFNTNFAFQSLSDVFAIALHEAGNVFGLKDNDDPNSPMHAGTIPTALVPTANDLTALGALWGVRQADANETLLGGHDFNDNDSFDHASLFRLNELVLGGSDDDDGIAGAIPSLLYGDVTVSGDVDYHRLPSPDASTGPLTIKLRTEGISLLRPRLRVFDHNQQLLATAASSSALGGGSP